MGAAPHTLANALRALSMDAVEAAKSGHPGMPMGMADVAAALFAQQLKFDASDPQWPDRDRFILSAGHGSMLLYALLHLTGYADMTLEELKRFRQLGARTAGHPEYGHAAGVETTTGPLGQGLANAVGFAMAERALAARFGPELVDHRTWVIAGDGCLMEGLSHEAAALAGRHKLEKLIVLWDDNGISIDGAVALSDATDQRARFEACGWRTLACDGHDPAAISAALQEAALPSGKPTLVACRTVIGFGAPTKAGGASAHGEPLGAAELAAAKAALGWTHGPFEVPAEVRAAWAAIGARGRAVREAWSARLEASPQRAAFAEAMRSAPPEAALRALQAHTEAMATQQPKLATRAASGLVLDALAPVLPGLFGGSADLSKSNVTQAKGQEDFTPENPSGRYVRYGVREHGMAAAMNGLALHGGLIPYGGTFLCFADYARPALRLAALMGLRTIHVMTHDSIGLGEDGPTHQPIEHLASLRAIPNLYVFRPADAVETAECWAAALQLHASPSVLALSRQATPALRRAPVGENLSARGAYELAPASSEHSAAALFATGTEVAIALEAQRLLEERGVPTRVVSCPCFELFAEQEEDYRDAVLGPVAELRFGVEAGVAQGWLEAFELDGFVGLEGFGASAPAPELYTHFGLTAEAVAEGVLSLLEAQGLVDAE